MSDRAEEGGKQVASGPGFWWVSSRHSMQAAGCNTRLSRSQSPALVFGAPKAEMRDWRRYVPSIVRHLRAYLERRDPHWPAQLAALVALLLYLTLREKLTVGPRWLVPALEALLLVALVLATPWDEMPGSQARQRLAVALVGVLAVATLVALGLLAHFIVEGERGGHGLTPKQQASADRQPAAPAWARIIGHRPRRPD
jgi:hypothetical protein